MVTNSYIEQIATPIGNSFFELRLVVANSLSRTSQTLQIEGRKLIKLAIRYPGVSILKLESDVGVHFVALDPWFIVNSCPSQAKMIHKVRLVNDAKTHYLIAKVAFIEDQFKKLVITCLGLAFEAGLEELHKARL